MTAHPDFEELVASRGAHLLRSAYRLTGDWALAEDLAQTALAKTYLRWSRIESVAAGEVYARRVMVTTYTKWWHRRWRGEQPTGAPPERAGTDPYDAVDDRDVLRRALADLPPAHRAVLVLRFMEDLSEPQVADLLGCSVGTVKSRTSRALDSLRRRGFTDPARIPLVPCEELA